MSKFSDLSKEVGWSHRACAYPTLAQVESGSDHQILSWQRHLPSPENSEQEAVMNLVGEKFTAMRKRLEE